MSYMNAGSQMPMMISSSASFCILALGGAGLVWWMSSNGKNNKATPSPSPPVLPPTTPDFDAGSNYYMRYGGQSLSADGSNCGNKTYASMVDGTESDNGLWRAIPVNPEKNTFNLKSINREMNGCSAAFLTASSTCNGTSLEEPKYLDRQEWVLMDLGNGVKQIRSLSCMNSNMPSYLEGGGRATADRRLKLTNKGGTPFRFDAVA